MKKKAIQRAIPLTQAFTLVSAHYSSIEDGTGTMCENCGRLIANVATVKGLNDGKHYDVGMDCAETLTGIAETLEFRAASYAFQAAKSARARILKNIKKAKEAGSDYKVRIKTNETPENYFKQIGSGIWYFDPEPNKQRLVRLNQDWVQYPAEHWEKFVLPMIQSLAKDYEPHTLEAIQIHKTKVEAIKKDLAEEFTVIKNIPSDKGIYDANPSFFETYFPDNDLEASKRETPEGIKYLVKSYSPYFFSKEYSVGFHIL